MSLRNRRFILLGVGLLFVAIAGLLSNCGGGEKSAAQPTATPQAQELDRALVASGKAAAQKYGCLGCHSVDGFPMYGPTWKGLYGSQLTFTDGTTALADEAFLIESIKDPLAKVVQGFQALMPPKMPVADDEINAIIVYIKSVR